MDKDTCAWRENTIGFIGTFLRMSLIFVVIFFAATGVFSVAQADFSFDLFFSSGVNGLVLIIYFIVAGIHLIKNIQSSERICFTFIITSVYYCITAYFKDIPVLKFMAVHLIVCACMLIIYVVFKLWQTFPVITKKQEVKKVKKEKQEQEDKADLYLSAVHEAAHTLAAYHLKIPLLEAKISLMNSYVNIKDSRFQNAERLKELGILYYSGSVGETMVLGQFLTGSMGCIGSDFTRVKKCIVQYILLTDKNVSKTGIKAEISDKIIRLSKEWYAEAERLMVDKKQQIEAMATKLITKEDWTKEELYELLHEKSNSLQTGKAEA